MCELHVDFDTFWHSAVALTQGADIYDDAGAKLTNLNPPLLTVLLAPFAAARRPHRVPRSGWCSRC